MATNNTNTAAPDPGGESPKPTRFMVGRLGLLLTMLGTAVLTGLLVYLLVSIFRHKTETANPYLRFVDVTEETTDPEPWGVNWKREYDRYKMTVTPTKTNFGGGDVLMIGDESTVTREKAEMYPFLTRMFAGYAFSLDYRDRRGHAYMLLDQEKTRRVTERPQPGACLHCHASVVPTYRRLGREGMTEEQLRQTPDERIVQAGFVKLSAMPYLGKDGKPGAHDEVVKTGSMNPQWNGKEQKMEHVQGAHPVSCVDCHDPKTMAIRVTRPGFINGIKALAEGNGPVLPGSSIETWRKGSRKTPYDPNVNATRAEMRTYVCAQCHVEYYCGPKVTLLFPWNNGLKVEEIESFYDAYKFPDGHRFYDWQHAETGAELLKAQHPEFETWSQGIHARSGVSCADCHMPYVRQGSMKVSDHWVRSPLTMVNNSCQQCHEWSEDELKARVDGIQQRNLGLMQRAGQALTDFLDTFKLVRAPWNADPQNIAAATAAAEKKVNGDPKTKDLPAEEKAKAMKSATATALNEMWAAHVAETPELKAIGELQRKAQWRLDFVAAENSMGFHAPQETARVLGESVDYFRQAQLATMKLLPAGTQVPVTTNPAVRGGH